MNHGVVRLLWSCDFMNNKSQEMVLLPQNGFTHFRFHHWILQYVRRSTSSDALNARLPISAITVLLTRGGCAVGISGLLIVVQLGGRKMRHRQNSETSGFGATLFSLLSSVLRNWISQLMVHMSRGSWSEYVRPRTFTSRSHSQSTIVAHWRYYTRVLWS